MAEDKIYKLRLNSSEMLPFINAAFQENAGGKLPNINIIYDRYGVPVLTQEEVNQYEFLRAAVDRGDLELSTFWPKKEVLPEL